jgi:hypothetical protein
MIYSQGCSGRKSWQNDIRGMLYHWNRLLHLNKKSDLESDLKLFMSTFNVNPGEIKSLRKIRNVNNDINDINDIISKRIIELNEPSSNVNLDKLNEMIDVINEKSMDYATQQKLVLAKPIHEKSYYFFENGNQHLKKDIKEGMYGMHIIQDNDPHSSVYIYDKNADNSNNVFSYPTTSREGNVVYFDNKKMLKKDSVSMRAYHHFRKISSQTFGVILLSEIIDFFTLEGYKSINIIDTSCRTWDDDVCLDVDYIIRKERNVKRKLK